MVEIENYKIAFIKRTQEILKEKYPSFEVIDREVTFLMNCLLGLIIAISENEKRECRVFKGNIDDDFVKLIPSKIGFINKKKTDYDLTDMDLTDLTVNVGHKKDLKGKSKLRFINKIRNGIAHQNIQGINENKKWVGVRLWNSTKNNWKDFEIVFTINELKNFAIYLSEEYLGQYTENSEKKSK